MAITSKILFIAAAIRFGLKALKVQFTAIDLEAAAFCFLTIGLLLL